MCGIAGIYSFQFKANLQTVKQMTDVLIHRGPDGEGHWISENNQVAFGHRRLSVIDLSEKGKQPMHYDDRYTISFNGEIYNYLQIKNNLIKKGYSFKSNTDTEVLLALYDLKKEDCLNDLDGMFAFAIWDNFTKTLFCARDRFGEKPFYFYTDDNQFVFASEIKALFKAGVKKEINNKRLINYLATNAIEDIYDKSTTFYANIFALEASHFLQIKDNKIQKKKYYHLNYHQTNNISINRAAEHLRYLLKESVKLRTISSDVQVGLSLSGGVDSSIIFHEINQINPKVNSFTASFPGFSKDETSLVKLLHQNYNAQAHFVCPDANTYINDLDKLFHHQDEPIINANIHAQWCVYKLAKENNITVLLDGQGADEVFAGYHLYFKPFLQELYRTNRKQYIAEVQNYNQSSYFTKDIYFFIESLFPKLFHGYSIMRGHHKGQVDDIDQEYFETNKMDLFSKKYLKPELNDHLNYNLFFSGFEHLLRYGDRSSMAHSREVRLPFLDHKIVEFAASLPIGHKINKGYAKYLERLAYDKILPNEIIWKKEKIGYEVPQENWPENPIIKDKINTSIELLISEKIISRNNYDNRKWWRYIQIAKLLEK